MLIIKLCGLETRRMYGEYFSPSKKNPKLAMMKAVKYHGLHPHAHKHIPNLMNQWHQVPLEVRTIQV